MKKAILLIFLLTVLFSSTNAQQQQIIALQVGEEVTFFNNLDSAIIAAPQGAEIYLPPGIFQHNTNLLIDKRLNIYGVGHYLVSTYTMMRTVIAGDIKYVTGSDSSVIAGVYCDNISFGTSAADDALSNILIQRCNANNINLGLSTNPPVSSSIFIQECVVRGSLNGYNAENCVISKSIFNNTVYSFSYLSVSNSVFLGNYYIYYNQYYCPIYSVNSSLIQNNIFKYSGNQAIHTSVTNSAFLNNLFVQNLTNFSGNSNVNNIVSVSTSLIFVNQSGTTFSYDHNYHLVDDSPGKNAGNDGTDIGIYGTDEPYKELGIPFTPRIMEFKLRPQGNTIQLNTSVEAQER
ncbi:MAG TPA: hypothetical protein PKY56_04560 [Candidatus Kapabacteria bacterium]|nr:hypothetical protein [Candidatus Kapabacteria bacterium]HPO61696.1 hypothetical protein [Candidatus Kapabacteria bacterium]